MPARKSTNARPAKKSPAKKPVTKKTTARKSAAKKAAAKKPAAARPSRASHPLSANRIWEASYPTDVRADATYPVVPVTALLDDAVSRFGDSIAIDFEGNTMTYREFATAVDRFASVLRDMGVGKGTRVGTLLPNVPQVVIAYFAALRLGAIVVCNNPLYTERELEHQFNDAQIEVLVVLDLMYAKVKAIRSECPKLREVVVASVFDNFHGVKAFLGPKLKKNAWTPIGADEPVKRWKAVMKTAKGGVTQTAIDPLEDLALLQYTGGTTGLSKGVMLTHHNIVTNCHMAKNWLSDVQVGKETVLGALPLFHSYGQTMCMNLGVFLAGTIVLVPNPRDLGHVLKTIQRTKPTIFPGVPTLYANLLQHADLSKTDMKSIRVCGSGAAPLPLDVQQRWEAVTGGRLVEGYGLSETSPLTHMNPIYGKRKIGTIGLPMPGTECMIVDVEDPTIEIDPPGPGELCIRGPQVMQGYWNNPEETEFVLRDGWLYTGDIVEVDDEGYFTIVDRKKDMILVGGFNVYPRDVEEVLYTHPKVLECAVVGLPHPTSGEMVKAYITLKPGQTATVEEVEAFCRENLTAYKVPKAYEFRDELPKTMIGKVLRRVLVEEEKAKMQE